MFQCCEPIQVRSRESFDNRIEIHQKQDAMRLKNSQIYFWFFAKIDLPHLHSLCYSDSGIGMKIRFLK